MIRWFLLIVVAVIPIVSGASKGAVGVPIGFVFFQFVNFSLFIALLIYFVRRKLLDYLNNQHHIFITDSKKAQDLESQQISICSKWEKDLQALSEKTALLDKQVQTALQYWTQTRQTQEENSLKILKEEQTRYLKKQRLQELYRLKNQIGDLMMSQIKKQIQLNTHQKIRLEQVVIHKLDQLSSKS